MSTTKTIAGAMVTLAAIVAVVMFLDPTRQRPSWPRWPSAPGFRRVLLWLGPTVPAPGHQAADTTNRMKAAVIEDQQAERWVSMSDWCGDAVHAAVQAARNTDGGVLPTPPARLPNRLIR